MILYCLTLCFQFVELNKTDIESYVLIMSLINYSFSSSQKNYKNILLKIIVISLTWMQSV
jgi:hypothetical protein